jgi:hypothetical protein
MGAIRGRGSGMACFCVCVCVCGEGEGGLASAPGIPNCSVNSKKNLIITEASFMTCSAL